MWYLACMWKPVPYRHTAPEIDKYPSILVWYLTKRHSLNMTPECHYGSIFHLLYRNFVLLRNTSQIFQWKETNLFQFKMHFWDFYGQKCTICMLTLSIQKSSFTRLIMMPDRHLFVLIRLIKFLFWKLWKNKNCTWNARLQVHKIIDWWAYNSW